MSKKRGILFQKPISELDQSTLCILYKQSQGSKGIRQWTIIKSLTTLGTSIDWFTKISDQTFQPLIHSIEGIILCFTIGDEH